MTKKITLKRINLDLALDEAKRLESYFAQTGKSATDVIQELIRAMPY